MNVGENGAKVPPAVREAIDANDSDGLRSDPTHKDGKVDIAADESFPASDPPAHISGTSGEPAPSSGYDEATEARRSRVAERAHGIWETEGRPDGRDIEHWLRAEAEDSDEETGGA
jgi:hypothetical protein